MAVLTEKGDFTTNLRLLWISALALWIGGICAVVALILLRLIAFFTFLFYAVPSSQTVDWGQLFSMQPLGEISPVEAVHHLGLLSILIPVVGGLIIGLIARYGSERIRGHGIPEALEAILIGRSRMSPKVAVLKPVSSAISIGSGGPFGAEGPIIMTGGACGSLIAQLFRLSAAERKTLLVAGAAGGMAATFATPVAAVLLAVELLLFEWKPRSLIPVALACLSAMIVRSVLPLTPAPLFGTTFAVPVLWKVLVGSTVVGLLAGFFSLLLTRIVYASEDLFHRLPIHWMWWPALGGLFVGMGGYLQPRALAVGYDIIRDLLHGQLAVEVVVPLILIKAIIWSTALGSGTSGGVLAPLLIMGGALGTIIAPLLPGDQVSGPPLWALTSMAAIMGGTMRSPLTGTVFALELTRDINVLPGLLGASIVAHGFTVLFMKRSILTEKVARRGYHISREYSVDPLEQTSIGEVMTGNVVTVPASMPVAELLQQYFHSGGLHRHQAYPVVDAAGNLVGVLTRRNLLEDWVKLGLGASSESDLARMRLILAYDLVAREPIVAFPWESCRTAAERMAAFGVGRLPVVDPDNPRKVIGIVSRGDLLKPRARQVEEEMRRERFLGLHHRSEEPRTNPAHSTDPD